MNVNAVIESAILNNFVYSKVHFDNAKDTQELLTAAEESRKILLTAVEYQLRERVEEMLVQRVEDDLTKGDVFVRVGGKIYEINPVEAKE